MNARLVFKSIVAAAVAAVALLAVVNAGASVVISGTRVIYRQEDSEVTVKLSNVGKSPALIQTWMDEGDASISASQINVPFTITPPLSRVDPSKGQTLRIIYTGETLPPDRESVFWLNVLEVPPKPDGDLAQTNHIQLAFRSRIKLFFRPSGLKGSPDDAPAQLTWQVVHDRGEATLAIRNPTAYNVSLTDVELVDGPRIAKNDDGVMVGPGQTTNIMLKGSAGSSPAAFVRFHSLNDFGGAVEGKAQLSSASAASVLPAISAAPEDSATNATSATNHDPGAATATQ